MQITKRELTDIIKTAVEATLQTLESKGRFGTANSTTSKAEKTAYQRCEQLLFNYRNFQKIVEERRAEIEYIKQYGAPSRSAAVVQYGGNNDPRDVKMEEEKKEIAIRKVEKILEPTLQAIDMIDRGMATLQGDPYYRILEMRYFEGRTQEDIAVEFNCTQQTISNNKTRLVKELAVKLFPDKVVNECLS